jgi:sugar phosphate isomerase/epimerase
LTSAQFGISTHLYHDERLGRDHFVEIAAHAFDAVEIFANRPHFDYSNAAAIREAADAARDARLSIHSVHAPIADALSGGRWGTPYSIASSDDAARRHALQEVAGALRAAADLQARYLIVHLGVPDSQQPPPADNRADAAARSLEALDEIAGPLGVRLALEVMPNALSGPDALVRLLEEDLELSDAGLCLDFGHAFLMGDLLEAVETCSGHVVTTHVHDNGGGRDEHLVPFEGRIDWDAALMGMRKIGYDGAFIFELAASAEPRAVLERAARARARFERMLAI